MTTVLKPSESVRNALVSAAKEGGVDQGLRGAEAGYLVRSLLPGFSPKAYGVRSLKQFIEEFVPELVIVGYSGVDPVYGLTEAKGSNDRETGPSTSAPSVPRDSVSAWRVWVSPRSGRVLQIDRESGKVQVADANEPTPDQMIRISPVEGGFHREIATEFLRMRDDLQESTRSRLTHLVEESKDDWWRAWASLLKAEGGTVYSDWMVHRSRRLFARFQQELSEYELSRDACKKAGEEVRPKGKPFPRKAHQLERIVGADNLLQIALRTLPALTEDELRAINLPLGKVYDALVKSTRNQ